MLWLRALCRLNGPAYCNDKDFQWHWGFTYFLYLFVFIQERVLFWLRIPKCESFHALRLWCQRYRAWWWMYSYSRLQNWLYDLAQCVSLLYRFSVPELKLKRSELTHSILSLFSHSLPPLYIWLSSPLMSSEVIWSQCQDWEAFRRIMIVRLGCSSLHHTFCVLSLHQLPYNLLIIVRDFSLF